MNVFILHHYQCIVGFILEEYFLIYSYYLLVSLLSGARNQRNSSLSEQIYNRIENIFPNYKEKLIPAAILLANTYQSSGNFEKATDIKKKLSVTGAKKQQGLSWTEIDGKIFVSVERFDLICLRKKEIFLLEIWCS